MDEAWLLDLCLCDLDLGVEAGGDGWEEEATTDGETGGGGRFCGEAGGNGGRGIGECGGGGELHIGAHTGGA